jgi:multidrug resistance efflux pump
MVQKIPWIYLLAFLGLAGIPAIKTKIIQSEEYFGIAENQIRSYTRASDVIIQSIRVKLGQLVLPGDTLMVFHPRNLYYKREDLASQSRAIGLDKKAADFELDQEIAKLQNQRRLLFGGYDIKLKKLIENKRLGDSLALLVLDQPLRSNKYEMEKAALDQELSRQQEEIDHRINALYLEKSRRPQPENEKLYTLSNEIQRISVQEKELVLIADIEGVVGQLDYTVGDPVNAYQSLIKIYSKHPTLVTTYIHEQYLGSVTIADQVTIRSISQPTYQISGKILNLGSRITALPDRLKKNPDLKSWGRELQIEIPADNMLIQGEKVKVFFSGL